MSVTSRPIPQPEADLSGCLLTCFGAVVPPATPRERPRRLGPDQLTGLALLWQTVRDRGLAQALLNHSGNELLIAVALTWYARFGRND